MSPLLLKITTTSDGGDSKTCGSKSIWVVSFVIPYTMGEWKVTDPIKIALHSGTNVLHFTRKIPDFGLTLKDLVLIPVALVSWDSIKNIGPFNSDPQLSNDSKNSLKN